MTTYEIPRFRYDRLADSIQKLNRRADRLGVEGLTFAPTGGQWCHVEYQRSRLTGERVVARRWEVIEVELEGGSIRLPGWTFCGTVEHLDGENVLRAVPGQTIPEHYRDAAKACDHCHLDRQRIDTFIVVSDAGEYRQIGRSCTADYLGSIDPQRLASFMEAVHDAVASDGEEGDDDRPTRYRETYRPDEVVAIANAAVRTFGFHKSSEPDSTKGDIAIWMQGRGKAYEAMVKRGMQVTADDYSEAEAMVEWAAAQGRDNDYLANLGAYARQERVDDRAMGLLASLPTAYLRAMGQAAERKARDEQRAADREHATPAPTGRQTVEGVVVGRKVVETDYGTTYKLTLLMEAGWRLYVSEPSSLTACIGDTVRLTAAIEPSQDDPTFAWGKRPTKGSIIAHADDEAAAPAATDCAHEWMDQGEDAKCDKCGIISRGSGEMARALRAAKAEAVCA